ncbi:MAG: type II secretion system protein GspN [Deltaproteobacteria bacterium]|nr:type II secretion system protein GspN [Deltaproteobacteria bacterium]
MNKLWQTMKDMPAAVKDLFVDYKWVLVKAVAYAMVVIVFYLVFLWFLFPYDDLTTRFVEQFGNSAMNVSVGSTTGAFPIGLKLRDVVIREAAAGSGSSLFEASEIKLIPGIFSLLRGWLRLSVDARLYHGSAQLSIGARKGDFVFSGVIKDIDIDTYPMLKSSYGLNMIGTFNARLSMRGSMDDVTKDTGKGLIHMQGVTLEPSNLLGVLTLPKIEFGDITLPVFIQGGRIDFQEASQTSKDINSQLDGSIALRRPVESSALDLRLKFNPTPALEAQIRKTVPIFMLSRAPSGYFNVTITGNLNMPRFAQ